MKMRRPDSRSPDLVGRALTAVLLTLGGLALATGPLAAQEAGGGEEGQEAPAPYRGYLEAHAPVEEPLPLAGGPVHVRVTQTAGGVHVGLPSPRRLDEDVMGTPDRPRAFAGTPLIDGIPLGVRASEGGEYTRTTRMTPTGDLKSKVLPNGRLEFEAWDVTATDAATTEDSVAFRASWEDGDGNSYAVTCCTEMYAHGTEMPTFGGVVTNHILHGSSRLWTAMMPTFFTYAAFWGKGSLLKNGEVRQEGKMIHGMLTEYVRTEGYKMAFDREVTPTRRHFHLMVFPMDPAPEKGGFVKSPARTGFMLPNGKELPFWHVMFGNLNIDSDRAAPRGGG